ncbi:MAG TPA: DoxX family membrane protein [Anaerolineae bacterium]|nr:DoxX family membrane protein [Anaerolineae bacterium]
MKENTVPRTLISALRILLGIIFLATWKENLDQGLYTAEGFRGFMEHLADGHPLEFYRAFLLDVMAPLAPVFGPFQMVAELGMGLALLSGTLTRLAGAAATLFFVNLFLAYLNTALGEWIWTYVLLIAVAAVAALGRAGLSWGVDARLRRRYGDPRLPVY